MSFNFSPLMMTSHFSFLAPEFFEKSHVTIESNFGHCTYISYNFWSWNDCSSKRFSLSFGWHCQNWSCMCIRSDRCRWVHSWRKKVKKNFNLEFPNLFPFLFSDYNVSQLSTKNVMNTHLKLFLSTRQKCLVLHEIVSIHL